VYRAGVISAFANPAPILSAFKFQNIQGNALSYNRIGSLPNVAFRGVNEEYTAGAGVINPQVDPLVIAGGNLDVDSFLVKTGGESARDLHEAMKAEALALCVSKKLIKGDSTSDPREFDGLQARLTGDQLISAGSTASVPSPVAAARGSVGGDLQWGADDFGRRISAYNGLPIIVFDRDETDSAILPFSEASSTGGSSSTSIYCISNTEDGVAGIQSGPPEVTDHGKINSGTVYRTTIEWYMGMAVFNGRAAARLYGIKDAAVTA